MTLLSSRIVSAANSYRLFTAVADHLQPAFLLLVRLYWGWQFFVTGKAHLTHLADTTDFFHSLGIPLPHLNAIMAGSTECFGGLLLIVGLGSRLTSIALLGTMAVAYLTADLDKVKGIFSNPDAFVTATPFLFLMAAAIVLVFGPGKFSVDYFVCRFIVSSTDAVAQKPGRDAAAFISDARSSPVSE